MYKVGVIVPYDNDTVFEEINNGLGKDYKIIPYKMRELGQNGKPSSEFENIAFYDNLKKAGIFFMKKGADFLVYGRGYGTYTAERRKKIKNFLETYIENVIIPTDVIINYLKKNNLKRIALILPYTKLRGEIDKKLFIEEDFSIEYEYYMRVNDGQKIATISSENILSIINNDIEIIRSCDSLVIQCTALHTIDVINSLDEIISIPIISSNSIIINEIKNFKK